MTFYDRLQHETYAEQAELQAVPIIQAAMTGNVSLAQYVAFLTEAYHHVKHTVPLLMACGSKLPESKEWLREATAEYIKDEVGHQEWILSDIKACGGDSEKVRSGNASMATEMMVAYAYDTIARHNPIAFFGMVHVLEGTSIQLATHAAEQLKKSLGLPNKAFTYLNTHGSLDLKHVEFFQGLVNRLEAPSDQNDIIHCAKVVFKLYGNIFRSIESRTQS